MSTQAPAPGRFASSLAFTWKPDNDGQPYHVTPGDHGGPTAWGVTFTTYAAWRRAHGQTYPTADDLRAAQKPELATLIQTLYWNAVQADHLPPGVDLLVYEFGFGSGPLTSAEQLQRVLNGMGVNLEPDGNLGPHTLAAATQANRRTLIEHLGAAHAAFYQSLKQPLFLRGWLRRNTERLALALAS